MGIIRKTIFTATAGTAAFVGYLHATTSIQCPLPSDDPIWTSKPYRRFNIHRNASTQDIVFRRIPIDEVKPELLQKEGALVGAFCQGVWSGLGTCSRLSPITAPDWISQPLTCDGLAAKDTR